MQMRHYARAKAIVETPDLSEEDMQKQGLSEQAISLVMGNMARAIEERR